MGTAEVAALTSPSPGADTEQTAVDGDRDAPAELVDRLLGSSDAGSGASEPVGSATNEAVVVLVLAVLTVAAAYGAWRVARRYLGWFSS